MSHLNAVRCCSCLKPMSSKIKWVKDLTIGDHFWFTQSKTSFRNYSAEHFEVTSYTFRGILSIFYLQ